MRATIKDTNKSVVFTINGTPSSDSGDDGDDDDDPPPATTITRTLDIDVSGSGSTREVTVTALENGVSQRGIFVELSVSSGATLSDDEGPTPLESTLTLPDTAGTYTLRASTTAAGYSAVTEDIEVTVPGTGDPTPRTTEINPVVHINAANRPPMLWVDGGTIYALVGAEVQEFASGVEGAMNLTIAGNKVYWTERTGESAGTINAANLDGSGAKELKSIMAVPMGIAVDTAAGKVYWTNSRGRIQSADLNGKKIQNVVDGLGMPGDMVLSNSIQAPTATAAKSTTTKSTTTAANKYDVNGDGSVDSKDVTALIDAISLGVTANKYDVNGDGKVNILDARAVNANLDAGAAGAPTRLGMKLSAVQIDRLQEQIDLLIATGDRSPATMKMLIYLQQLIVMARPEKTQLLANYPTKVDNLSSQNNTNPNSTVTSLASSKRKNRPSSKSIPCPIISISWLA